VVDREAEVRPASWANGAWPTTKRGAAWQRPQPTGIVYQSPKGVVDNSWPGEDCCRVVLLPSVVWDSPIISWNVSARIFP